MSGDGSTRCDEPREVSADEIYLLMAGDYRISRNERARWFFNHLHSGVELDEFQSPGQDDGELRVVGARSSVCDGTAASAAQRRYVVGADTAVTCMSRCYRLVFIMDFSPSVAIVDSSSNILLHENLFACLEKCLRDLVKPIKLPQSTLTLSPKLYMTVIAYSPIQTNQMDQVLLQGCFLQQDNLERVLAHLSSSVAQYINALARFTRPVMREICRAKRHRRDTALLTGNLFVQPQVPVASGSQSPNRHARLSREDSADAEASVCGRAQQQQQRHTAGGRKGGTWLAPRRLHRRHKGSMSSVVVDSLYSLRHLDERWLGGPVAGRGRRSSPRRQLDLLQVDALGYARRCLAAVGFVGPHWALLNMLRLGMIGTQMLPDNTQSNVVVITDGVLGVPDASALQALLAQLRSYTIMCSFIHVQARLTQAPGFGHSAQPELMQFVANATFGAYLPDCGCTLAGCDAGAPQSTADMGVYHKSLLCWSFQRALTPHKHLVSALNPWIGDLIKNNILRRRQEQVEYETTVRSLLYVRLREGYTLKSVSFAPPLSAPMTLEGAANNTRMTLELRLVWQPEIAIDYTISADWPVALHSVSKLNVLVSIEAPYQFLRDVAAPFKTRVAWPHPRRAAVEACLQEIQSLLHADRLMLHLHLFSMRPVYYTVPGRIVAGTRKPLFYLSPDSNSRAPARPEISSRRLAETHAEFADFWRPLCTMDMNIWQKWLHTHSLRLLLAHDVPVTTQLHVATDGVYEPITCRQAAALLHDRLADWCSFVLIEAQSYVCFHWADGRPPSSVANTDKVDKPDFFYIVRTCARPPALTVKVAFMGGIRGAVRSEIMSAIASLLVCLRVRRRPPVAGLDSDAGLAVCAHLPSNNDCRFMSLVADIVEAPAVHITTKPIERVLVRYERRPDDLRHIVRLAPYSDQPVQIDEATARSAILHNALARYYSVRRCLWQLDGAHQPGHSSTTFPTSAAGFMLHVITRRRLHDSFFYGFGANGMVTLCKEYRTVDTGMPFLVQYVMMPPTAVLRCSAAESARGSCASDRASTPGSASVPYREEGCVSSVETESGTQLVTELWVEPQHGRVDASAEPYLTGVLTHADFHKAIFLEDQEIIECLATFELLRLGCRNGRSLVELTQARPLSGNIENMSAQPQGASYACDASVCRVHNCYSLPRLLCRSQKASLLFSTLEYDNANVTGAGRTRNELLLTALHASLRSAHQAVFKPIDLCGLWTAIVQNNEQLLDATHADGSLVWLRWFASLRGDNGGEPSSRVGRYPELVAYVKELSRWRVIVLLVPATFEDVLTLNGRRRAVTISECGEAPIVDHEALDDGDDICRLTMPLFVFNCFEPALAASLAAAVPANSTSCFINKNVMIDYRCDESLDDSTLTQLHRQISRVRDAELMRGTSVSGDLVDHVDSAALRWPTEPTWFVRGQSTVAVGATRHNDAAADKNNTGPNAIEWPAAAEFDIITYCGRIDSVVYANAYVLAVYKGLLDGVPLSSADVRSAIEGRCDELTVEIDLSEFVPLVCSHVPAPAPDEGPSESTPGVESPVWLLSPQRSRASTMDSVVTFAHSDGSVDRAEGHASPAAVDPWSSDCGSGSHLRTCRDRLAAVRSRRLAPIPSLGVLSLDALERAKSCYPDDCELTALFRAAVARHFAPVPSCDDYFVFLPPCEGAGYDDSDSSDQLSSAVPCAGVPADDSLFVCSFFHRDCALFSVRERLLPGQLPIAEKLF